MKTEGNGRHIEAALSSEDCCWPLLVGRTLPSRFHTVEEIKSMNCVQPTNL